MPIKDTAFGGSTEGEEKPAKRKRRTKEELIADARIPDNEEIVEVKFTATKTTGERPWLVAVELFRDKKIEFVDPSLKYSVQKMDLQKEATAGGDGSPVDEEKIAALTAQWSQVQEKIDAATDQDEIRQLSDEGEALRDQIKEMGGLDPESDEAYSQRNAVSLVGKRGGEFVPENAMAGDEIIHGTKMEKTEKTYYVGHGHVLLAEPPTHEGKLIEAGARWFMHNGEWTSVALEDQDVAAKPAEANGDGAQIIEQTAEHVGEVQINGVQIGLWKISMGYLEKIGLPEYSSLQIGPTSAQTYVLDDGRRIKANMHDHEIDIPAAVVEKMQEAGQICEYVMRAERQAMINFLEAVKPGSTTPQ